MGVFRWIAFLPAAAVLVAIAQSIAGIIAESMLWWIAMPLVLFLGIFLAFSAYLPCGMMCPNPKIGSTIFLTAFILLEAVALFGSAGDMTWPVFIVRLYADGAIAFGAIAAAAPGDQSSPKTEAP